MIQQVRELAEKYTHAQLEACIDEHIRSGKNSCGVSGEAEEVMNILSKASYVRQMIEEGKAENLTDAIRKLALSMRNVQQQGKR